MICYRQAKVTLFMLLLSVFAIMPICASAPASAQPKAVPAQDPAQDPVSDLYPVDETVVVIDYMGNAVLILFSDLMKPGIDGKPPALRDIIFEHLMVLDAQRLKVTVGEDDIDRFLSHLQKANNLTRDQIMTLFKTELGFTSDEEIRNQLKRKQLIETILEERVKRHTIVSQQDIEAYWNEHYKEEATYTLKQVFIPTAAKTPEEINDAVKRAALEDSLNWGEPFTLKDHELAEDKRFITTKNVGDVIDIEHVTNGIVVTRLDVKVDAHVPPFDKKHYDEIASTLRRELFEKLLKEYQTLLLSQARITYTDERWKALMPNP